MATTCTDCKQPIFNTQSSTISTPICQGDCPEDINCNGEVTYSPCIEVSVALECAGTEVGDNLSVVLTALDEKVCDAVDASCTVKVNADDNCCGHLEDKIDSDSLTISVETSGSCKSLKIEESCWTWNDVLPSGSSDGRFKGKWVNFGAIYQTAQYSNVKECSVRLRGLVKNSSYGNSQWTVFVLPVGKRPLAKRRYSVIVVLSGSNQNGLIEVGTDGVVTMVTPVPANGYVEFSLDNIQIELN